MTKLDAALMLVPFDVINTLVTFGSEQAFLWVGRRPQDEHDYYFQLGRLVGRLTEEAWDRELRYRGLKQE